MLKKISSLMLLVASVVAYADILLDLHITLTQGEIVREVNKQVTIAENTSVELHRCERGQLIGYVSDVTEAGAQLNVQVNQCVEENCTSIANQTILLTWGEKNTVNLAHEDATLTVEVIAQRVETEQK